MDEKTLTGFDALSISAMTDRNRGDFMNDSLGIFFIFALLMMNNGWNGFGGRGPVGVLEGDLAASQAAQTTQLGRFVAWAGSGSQAAATAAG